MPKDYDVNNWYWFVEGDETKVYSSASGDYVPVSDATYTEWAADGSVPTRIANEAELGDVLATYSLRPTPNGILDGYKEHHVRGITKKGLAKILFWTVNEVRALKGQQPVTAAQYKQFLKDIM